MASPETPKTTDIAIPFTIEDRDAIRDYRYRRRWKRRSHYE